MLWAGPVGTQRRQVRRRGIAFVGLKTVLRKFQVVLGTPAIAADLGQNRGRRYRRHFAIAFDDGFGAHIQNRKPVAIDQHLESASGRTAALHRAAHGQQGGLQDVELVDFLH